MPRYKITRKHIGFARTPYGVEVVDHLEALKWMVYTLDEDNQTETQFKEEMLEHLEAVKELVETKLKQKWIKDEDVLTSDDEDTEPVVTYKNNLNNLKFV